MINNQRAFILQTLVLIAIAALWLYFYVNVTYHLLHENIASGFAFLFEATGFNIDMNLISYSPKSTNFRAFFVAILNTLLVSALAIIFSTILGTLLAYARVSHNWLLQKIAHAYVNIFCNLPLLVLVLFCYFALLQYMPQPDATYALLGIKANVRGIFIGNMVLIPEFVAMFLALSLYSASYIAEDIRQGLQSIDKGQIEAAIVCGLSPFLRFILIVLPLSARKILAPVIGQHLTTLKNSSLGVAIGYPELVSIFEGTVLNQTGQAIETTFMTMAFYLLMSLLTSYLTHIINHKMVIPSK